MESLSQEVTVTIDALSYGPYGIGREGSRVILVPHTVPGDQVRVRIKEEKKNYATGEVSLLMEPSKGRQTPPCPYFGPCGGCPWQQVTYALQLSAKEKNVRDALERIGGLRGFELLPILPSPREYTYRRRIRFQIDEQRNIGFYGAASHEMVEVEACLIADARLNEVIPAIRKWVQALTMKLWSVELVVGDGESAVVLVGETRDTFKPKDKSACSDLLVGQPGIQGVVLTGPSWRRCWGEVQLAILSEDNLTLGVDADAFLQVNGEANRGIMKEVLEWGEFGPRDRALELYGGAGNLTLPLAKRVAEVVAVEGDPRAVNNGRAQSRLNRMENIRWLHADVRQALPALVEGGERFSRVLLNPPRSGAKGLMPPLAALGAEKILYLSCNPSTLARDLAALKQMGYQLGRVRPFDLFPHTFHMETLAEMVR